MNIDKIKEILELYKDNFPYINNKEIKKWRAVKCFHDNWDENALDFNLMLKKSLRLTKNLLDSGNYFPHRMILEYAERQPEIVKQQFKQLFNEDEDLVTRITTFRQEIKNINQRYFSGKKDYQDPRAVIVYLTLRYPERYFFYKWGLLKHFIPLINYPYGPKMGSINNVPQYLHMCSILKTYIEKDSELIKMHFNRLTKNEYFDNSLNLLTQDVIFAAVNHLQLYPANSENKHFNLTEVKKDIKSQVEEIKLIGKFINFLENAKELKRIGDMGELLVLEFEKQKLKSFNISKSPVHISKTKGDGCGFDILSFNEKGEEIFIEVKTTTKDKNHPFYITLHELEKSKLAGHRFILYRLFNLNLENETAQFYIHKGELSNFCNNPVLFKVNTKKEEIEETEIFLTD